MLRQASDDVRSRAAMFVYEASLCIDLYIRVLFLALVTLPRLAIDRWTDEMENHFPLRLFNRGQCN